MKFEDKFNKHLMLMFCWTISHGIEIFWTVSHCVEIHYDSTIHERSVGFITLMLREVLIVLSVT
jgi:hypothetical protein